MRSLRFRTARPALRPNSRLSGQCSGVFLLLAVAAVACPRHPFPARFCDRPLAGLTHAEGAPVGPSQGIFNPAGKANVGLVKVGLKLPLRSPRPPVNQVSPR